MANRLFEVADKVVNGVPQTTFDTNSNAAVVMKWSIDPSKVPVMDGKPYVSIYAAEDCAVPSIWGGFGRQFTNMANSYTDKINRFFENIGNSGQSQNPEFRSADDKVFESPFKPVVIHTGIKVAKMPADEVLEIHPIPGHNNGIVFSDGVQLVFSDDANEICIHVYNFMPSELKISAGQMIGIGLFKKVEIECIANSAEFTTNTESPAAEQKSDGSVNLAKELGGNTDNAEVKMDFEDVNYGEFKSTIPEDIKPGLNLTKD